MNIKMDHAPGGNSALNIKLSPHIQSPQSTVTVNGSQSENAALTILRSLSSGTAFSANITDVNGNAVTIMLDGGQSFTANLLNNSDYNIGDRASFILQDNVGDSIVLKAVTTQATALETAMATRSLAAAGLAPTIRNRELVLQLMRNGMPIGKEALLDMVKELSANTDADMKDIIALKRMGIEINGENLRAYGNYKEYSGAIQSDIARLGAGLFESVRSAKDLEALVRLVLEDKTEGADGTLQGTQGNTLAAAGQNMQHLTIMEELRHDLKGLLDGYNAASGRGGEKVFGLSDKLQNAKTLQEFMTELSKALSQLENEQYFKDKLPGLLRGKRMGRLVSELVRDAFSMKPSELTDSEAVKEHIARNLAKLHTISDYAEANQDTALPGTVSRMSSNIEFLNSINQFMSAVQIPLNNIGEHGEGELYVYRRKKGREEDDTVKAFLHLDMEHLGALDIYVTLRGSSVSTNFKVEDESVLDFLEANMELLTKKLNEDGYNVSVSVSSDDDGAGFDFVKEVLAPELPVNEVKRFRFDMKA